jgi:hypothetical protein
LWKRELITRALAKLKIYVKEKLSLHLIAGFIVLLLIAAVFIAVGQAPSAEVAADCAYFVLAAGVILQLISFSLWKMPKTEIH